MTFVFFRSDPEKANCGKHRLVQERALTYQEIIGAIVTLESFIFKNLFLYFQFVHCDSIRNLIEINLVFKWLHHSH